MAALSGLKLTMCVDVAQEEANAMEQYICVLCLEDMFEHYLLLFRTLFITVTVLSKNVLLIYKLKFKEYAGR
jgi:hypothetical protein